jgi:hypothetical protein
MTEFECLGREGPFQFAIDEARLAAQ